MSLHGSFAAASILKNVTASGYGSSGSGFRFNDTIDMSPMEPFQVSSETRHAPGSAGVNIITTGFEPPSFGVPQRFGQVGQVEQVAGLLDNASDMIKNLKQINNLYNAFEGGHMDAFIDQLLNGDFSAAKRTWDLALDWGTPGDVPSAVDFGEAGMSAPDFQANVDSYMAMPGDVPSAVDFGETGMSAPDFQAKVDSYMEATNAASSLVSISGEFSAAQMGMFASEAAAMGVTTATVEASALGFATSLTPGVTASTPLTLNELSALFTPTVTPPAPTVIPPAPTVTPPSPTVTPSAPTVTPSAPTVTPSAPTDLTGINLQPTGGNLPIDPFGGTNAVFGVGSQLGALAAPGVFAPGGAATVGSVFGASGTGFGATGAFGTTLTAPTSAASGVAGTAIAGLSTSAVVAMGAAGIALFLLNEWMSKKSVGPSSNRAVVLGDNGLLQMGAAALDNLGDMARPDFEAQMTIDAINPLIQSGAVTISDWDKNQLSQFTLFASEGTQITGEIYLGRLIQAGNLVVNDEAAFLAAVAGFESKRNDFLNEQFDPFIGKFGDAAVLKAYSLAQQSGQDVGSGQNEALMAITSRGAKLGFGSEFLEKYQQYAVANPFQIATEVQGGW